LSGKLPTGLRVYRLLSAAAGPFTPILLARRLKRGKEHRQRLPERRGESRIARPEGPLVWLHGASVGELASVLPLIDRIRARGMGMLVTTGTVTSGGLAEQRLQRGVIHQFVPLDISRFVRRFLNHWQPDLALFVESELWPNMMVEASARGIPMILVNGRLSEHSFKRWQRAPNCIASLLRRLDLCLAGTASDAARLSELGAANVVTTGNLKLDVPPPPADPAALEILQNAVNGRRVIAATSTHPGEDEAIIEAHLRLAKNFSGLLTLIAPRHPDRGPGIAGIATAAGVRRVHWRFTGQTRRPKPGRGRQVERRNPAWPACLEFRRDLQGA
jgi:3-deoxy-D-manno-octulosonic-acid transferase